MNKQHPFVTDAFKLIDEIFTNELAKTYQDIPKSLHKELTANDSILFANILINVGEMMKKNSLQRLK